MRAQTNGTVATRPVRTGNATRRVACGVMGLAAVGLFIGLLVGAPLVSILLAGLLLLCPLLLWMPFRFERRALDRIEPTSREAARR